MKVAAAILAGFLLAACTTSKATQSIDNVFDWSALVQPKDAVPPECKGKPVEPPALDPKKTYTASEAAREQRKLRNYAKALRRQHMRCQHWAQGQR